MEKNCIMSELEKFIIEELEYDKVDDFSNISQEIKQAIYNGTKCALDLPSKIEEYLQVIIQEPLQTRTLFYNDCLDKFKTTQTIEFKEQIKENLVKKGLSKPKIKAIIKESGYLNAEEAVDWAIDAVTIIKQNHPVTSSFFDALICLLEGINHQHLGQKRSSEIFEIFGINPPNTFCRLSFRRILAGAKEALKNGLPLSEVK